MFVFVCIVFVLFVYGLLSCAFVVMLLLFLCFNDWLLLLMFVGFVLFFSNTFVRCCLSLVLCLLFVFICL